MLCVQQVFLCLMSPYYLSLISNEMESSLISLFLLCAFVYLLIHVMSNCDR